MSTIYIKFWRENVPFFSTHIDTYLQSCISYPPISYPTISYPAISYPTIASIISTAPTLSASQPRQTYVLRKDDAAEQNYISDHVI